MRFLRQLPWAGSHLLPALRLVRDVLVALVAFSVWIAVAYCLLRYSF